MTWSALFGEAVVGRIRIRALVVGVVIDLSGFSRAFGPFAEVLTCDAIHFVFCVIVGVAAAVAAGLVGIRGRRSHGDKRNF